jgi:hypothetical protein
VSVRRLLLTFALVLTLVLTGFSPSEAQARIGSTLGSWGHGRIVERDGHAIFEVDGKPFFLYGAAFFYERLPRDEWSSSMSQLAAMGINTLDLYVPWNWHELSDGDFDFSGRTSPRRDFDEVLRLAKQYDFKIILRPGPVVRNEWRNGGYPAWLLSRPEYGMPLHDLLEGRYPPTATLQNQHSDDAAAEWMRNTTHVTYAKRWLERVLHECEPYADRILAVALDDDQGAYIDNQTYPAPHFQAYLGWLRDVVHGVTGNDELTFINTYQMKVPASSPVWAMGNWYQSDAYSIGVHDESQLSFSFAQLATRRQQPLFASEFQAGWLQGAGEAYPRAADPSNTQLAIATMIGAGVRGIVNFPAQDTINPTGWEAPFANFAYAWDAALRLDGSTAARYDPTSDFGGFVRTFGPELAASLPRFDATIVYPGTMVDPQTSGGTTFSAIAAATITAQQACRDAGYACNLVDAGALGTGAIEKAAVILIPDFTAAGPRVASRIAERAASAARRYNFSVFRATTADDVTRAMRGRRAVVENGGGAVFSESDSPAVAGFLSVTNYAQLDRRYEGVSISLSGGRRIAVPPFVVRAHHAIVSPIDVHLATYFAHGEKPDSSMAAFPADATLAFTDCAFTSLGGDVLERGPELLIANAGRAIPRCTLDLKTEKSAKAVTIDTYDNESIRLSDFHTSHDEIDRARIPSGRLASPLPLRPDFQLRAEPGLPTSLQKPPARMRYEDPYRDGSSSLVFENTVTKLIVSPSAGARAFFFYGKSSGINWFSTVGGLRDDVLVEPPVSTTDRIAKYTHDFPAGTFNRNYFTSLTGDDSARFSYVFPDAVPAGATIAKSVTMADGFSGFNLDERVIFPSLAATGTQRAVSVSSFALDPRSLGTTSIIAPNPMPVAAGSTLSVRSQNAFGIRRGTSCIVVAWHAGDIDSATLQEHTDSVVARLTLAFDRPAHVIFREVSCNDVTVATSLADVEAEAQRAPQVTPSPARTP